MNTSQIKWELNEEGDIVESESPFRLVLQPLHRDNEFTMEEQRRTAERICRLHNQAIKP